MTDRYVWAAIAGMAVANYLTRFPAIAVVSRIAVPAPLMRWLSYVPAAVMGSLVASQVLMPEGRFSAPWASPHSLAALCTAAVYHYTRSFLGATIAGVAVFVGLRALTG